MEDAITVASNMDGQGSYSLLKSYEIADQISTPRRPIHTAYNLDKVPSFYYELKILGHGAFSKVVFAENIYTGEKVVIKMVDTDNPHGIEIATASLLHEINILKVNMKMINSVKAKEILTILFLELETSISYPYDCF